MKKIIVVMFAAVAFCSCVTYTPYRPTTKYVLNVSENKFENYTAYSLDKNIVYIGEDSNFPCLEFNLQKYINSKYDTYYWLKIYYLGDNWCFIPEGESLILLVDNEKIIFTGKGSWDYRNAVRGGVIELASYSITPAIIKKLSEAKIIEMQLSCDHYNKQATLKPDNIANIKQFYMEQVKNELSK